MSRSLLILVALLVTLALPLSASGAVDPSATEKRLLVRESQLLLGVEVKNGAYHLEQVTSFEQAAGRGVEFIQYGRAFNMPFEPELAEGIWARGSVPAITWELWGYPDFAGPEPIDNPAYSLRAVLAGDFDAYIESWALGLKQFGHPALLRLWPEMNGDWNPWSGGVNGNTAAEYKAAWRHVRHIFDRVYVPNVIWVWSPNINFTNSYRPLRALYPGDRYVEIIGLDGYNWGNNFGFSWYKPLWIFEPTLREIRHFAPNKSVMIMETATAKNGGNPARWVREFFQLLRKYPRLVGFTWFNQDKETDWRIEANSATLSTFAAELRRMPRSRHARAFRHRLVSIEHAYQRSLLAR